MSDFDQRFAVAPMLDWTTRHCRAFHRQLTKHAMLYTEMVATQTIIYSKSDPLEFSREWEGDVILQLGGSNPQQMAEVAKKLQRQKDDYPYAGINLNVGCPSPRVTSGSFGACLMMEPKLVADCMKALQDNCDLPLSIKTRIGVDSFESFEFLEDFILANRAVGITDFVLHARKAYLEGLSPKENREVPPLNYQRVYDMKAEYPDLNICINGGINTLAQAREQLEHVDGVMMGRQAFNDPLVLLGVDPILFGDFDNEVSQLVRIFDLDFNIDQDDFLDPKHLDAVRYPLPPNQMSLKHSITGGFNTGASFDPLVERSVLLQAHIANANRQRLADAFAEGRQFALEMNGVPSSEARHAPKGEISASARYARLANIAQAQAMFNALDRLRPYWQSEFEKGTALQHLFKPIMGAFNGLPGARQFRRYLSEHGYQPNANVDVLMYAVDFMYEKFVKYTESSS